ncbi:MAG: translational GTPase TypA [Coriobacteriia bacterium]|nr:translational GTPase TypA [Coriobacteriia bacterium]
MRRSDIRNVAIIAHVDHGKTTLVDCLLQATNVFRQNQQVDERVLDSNDQERERGITILSKNVAVNYKGIKINIIDTPGHADFGGEVERVLNMADAALLIVDAFEGPMPQTRFVLKHALAQNMKIILVVNKIDRDGARPDAVVDEVFDLMCELEASDEQLDFPVVYASASLGYARRDLSDTNNDVYPLLDMILDEVPGPELQDVGCSAMQISTVDHSSFVGRIGVGRLTSGTFHKNDKVLVVNDAGKNYETTIKQLFVFDNLDKTEVTSVDAGDIIAIVGVDDADIGDCVMGDVESGAQIAAQTFKPIEVEEPTMSVVFAASTSPLVGRDGEIVGGRQLRERLLREKEANISMNITELDDGIEVAGRGILHLSVLMETLRREGYEFQVGRPRVLTHDGMEPIEEAVVDVIQDYSGKVIEVFGNCGGEMTEMTTKGDSTHLVFRIPTRGTLGLNTKLLNATHGEATLFHHFSEYGPVNFDFVTRKNGVLVSMSTDAAVAYALDTLQERGRLFVGPGDECYEGMIVGESAKENDIVVNVAKTKNLGNQRASGSDKAIQLTPPVKYTLEDALEYIDDTELVEVTPKHIRMRKKLLSATERKKAHQL